MNQKQTKAFPHLAAYYKKVAGLSKTSAFNLDTSWQVCAVGNRILDELPGSRLSGMGILKVISVDASDLGYHFTQELKHGSKKKALTIINKIAALPSLFCSTK